MRAPLVPAGLVRAAMAPLVWIAASRGLDERYRQTYPVVPPDEEQRLAG